MRERRDMASHGSASMTATAARGQRGKGPAAARRPSSCRPPSRSRYSLACLQLIQWDPSAASSHHLVPGTCGLNLRAGAQDRVVDRVDPTAARIGIELLAGIALATGESRSLRGLRRRFVADEHGRIGTIRGAGDGVGAVQRSLLELLEMSVGPAWQAGRLGAASEEQRRLPNRSRRSWWSAPNISREQ